MPRGVYPHNPRSTAVLRKVLRCKWCLWAWKPETKFIEQPCPRCGHLVDARMRKGIPRGDLNKLKKWRKDHPHVARDHSRAIRRTALLLVSSGRLVCNCCGCDRPELLEINHKNGGGNLEFQNGRYSTKFYCDIAALRRPVDDLDLLCKVCNALHALELKYGQLPFSVTWRGTA